MTKPFTLGQDVKDNDGNVIAVAVACQSHTYFHMMREQQIDKFKAAWDKKFPGWENDMIVTLVYKEPQPTMTKQEFADWLELDISLIKDHVYNKLVEKRQEMCVPVQAVIQNV